MLSLHRDITSIYYSDMPGFLDTSCTQSGQTQRHHPKLPEPQKSSLPKQPNIGPKNLHLQPLPQAKTASTQTYVSVLENSSSSFSSLTDTKIQKRSNLYHNSYRPMVTFAPEKKDCNDDKLLQPNHDCMSQELQLSASISEKRHSGPPFDFMSHPKQVNPNNMKVARERISRPSLAAVLTILRYVGSLAINFCVFVISNLLETVPNERGGTVIQPTPQQQEHQPAAVMSTSKKSLRQRTAEKLNHHKAKSLVEPNPRTVQRARNKSIYVKNPKGLHPSTPIGLDSLFELQEGEWRCPLCNFKNPGDTFSCDCCLALKREIKATGASSSAEAQCPLDGSPSAMSCDSYSSIPKGDEVDSSLQADDDICEKSMEQAIGDVKSNTQPPTDSTEMKKRSTGSHDDEGNYKRINISTSNTQHNVEDMMDTAD